MVRSNIRDSWFHGYISAYEATRILEGSAVGTFIVRFSSTRPGNFVISVVQPSRQIAAVNIDHTLVEVRPEGYVIEQQTLMDTDVSRRTFANLTTLVKHYRHTLICPYSATLFQNP